MTAEIALFPTLSPSIAMNSSACSGTTPGCTKIRPTSINSLLQYLFPAHISTRQRWTLCHDVQDIIESIEISDDNGKSHCKLMSTGVRLDDGGLSLFMPSECNFIDLTNLHEMKLSVSGVCLQKREGSFTPYTTELGSQIYIEYDTGITVIGFLDMGEGMLESESRVMTEEVLPSLIQDVIQSRRPRLQFPPPATFRLRSVHFNESCIESLGKIHALLPRMMLNLSI